MVRSKWVVFVLALAMIAGTGALLAQLASRHSLGSPGVKVSPVPLFGEDGTIVTRQSVPLPEEVLGGESINVPITRGELEGLPRDTTFGRRLYRFPDGLIAQLTVVLMGSDRASIHQPQYCLVAQNWTIEKIERVAVPMDRPARYDLPVNKLTVSQLQKNKKGQIQAVSGLYVYWFVSGDKITADPLSGMMWSIAKTLLENGVVERWAYVSYFCTCLPGQEDATFERLKDFIRASTPQFQLVPSLSAPRAIAASARN
jgi:hypothetical protein